MTKDTKKPTQGHTKEALLERHNLSNFFNSSITEARNSLGLDFEAQITASLMLQANALISIKMATKLCSISRQEIDRRVHIGTFPKPIKLSGEKKAIRKAFRLQDILEWLKSPSEYSATNQKLSKANKPHR